MIRMLYVAGIAHLLRVESERGESSGPWPSVSVRRCYSARHRYAMRKAGRHPATPGTPRFRHKPERCGDAPRSNRTGLRKEARPAASARACFAP